MARTRTLAPGRLAQAKLLVRVPNWVGDAVICLPALRALRDALPQSEIALLARPWVGDVFPAQELDCRVIAYDTNGAHRGLAGRRRIAAELRQARFDAAILFQNAFDAALVTWLAGIPIRAGYSRQARRLLLTHAVAAPRKSEGLGHEAHYYLELLRRLGFISNYEPVEQISLPTSEAVRKAARAQLGERINEEFSSLPGRNSPEQLIVGISPGATFGTAKRWPATRFAELAARLHKEHAAACVFFGSPEEESLAEEVMTLAGVPALSLAGKTSLAEFIELVQGCDLFVTNDTGTMHVAAALGVPTLVIFGPTNEKETRPLGPRVELVAGEAFCRPCKLRQCPIDHRCMLSVSVERVFLAAETLLRRESLLPRESAHAAVASPRSGLVFEQGTGL
jgi:heptosyltransferase-2